jgi:hypothetical protein
MQATPTAVQPCSRRPIAEHSDLGKGLACEIPCRRLQASAMCRLIHAIGSIRTPAAGCLRKLKFSILWYFGNVSALEGVLD